MRLSSPSSKLFALSLRKMRRIVGDWSLAFVLMMPTAVVAERMSVQVERLSRDDFEATSVELTLDWPAGTPRGELELSAARVRWIDAGLQLDQIRWHCQIQREEDGWLCSGPITAKGMRAGQLLVGSDADGVRGEFSRGKVKVSVVSLAESNERMLIEVQKLPMDWLQPLLAMAWPQARFTAGSVNARLTQPKNSASLVLVGALSVEEFGIDTDDGRWASAALNAQGSVRAAISEFSELSLALTLNGGEILAGPAYVLLPNTPVQFELTAHQAADGVWTLPELRWVDGKVLSVAASASLDVAADNGFGGYAIAVNSDDLDTCVNRYARTLLASLGLPNAAASGHLALNLQADGDGESQSSLRFDTLDLATGDGRLQLDGLVGDARFGSGGETLVSHFEWSSGELLGIPLGAAQFELRSHDSTLELAQPVQVSVLDGSVTLSHARWSPRDEPSQLDVGLQLMGLDMAKLSKQFGWPAFSGSLSGQIPSARYSQGRLDFAGGLRVDVFDGRVQIDALSLERPFAAAPTLNANVILRDLDLQPLTAAFGFGEITGRLDGKIADLRLLDWQPVAFDAHFATGTRKGVKRRISQRAVNDLSRVGGGLVAGLQSTALSVFDSFGYRRIGIGCVLVNNTCTMSGIERDAAIDSDATAKATSSAATGYTVVEGAGLPRITVNGFAREVDWPVLLARLQAVSDGGALRIE
ncbi:MAG: hypothetical protein ACT4NL_17070 [Pseudomarimonas sp.]